MTSIVTYGKYAMLTLESGAMRSVLYGHDVAGNVFGKCNSDELHVRLS